MGNRRALDAHILLALHTNSFRLNIDFRNPFAGSLSDDDAMNVIVRDWIRS